LEYQHNTYGIAYYNIYSGRWLIRDIDVVNNERGNSVRETKPRHQHLSASPPAPLRRERGVISHGNEGSSFGVI